MKILFHIMFFLTPIYCLSQTVNNSINERIKSLIEKNSNTTTTNLEKDELRIYGYSIQNRGFRLEEIKHDYQNALIPIDSAIIFWVSIKDTANEANLRKYKGMLLGNLNRFNEGKQEIRKAINLYKECNKDYGIAVSQYDMSQVFDMEDHLDSALIFQNIATAFWINRKDSSRIIVNNTQLIHLYTKLKDYSTAEKIQMFNETILKTNEHWNPTINFYYASFDLFRKINNMDKAELFERLYYDKLEELKKKGIIIKSIYDKD